MTEMELSLKHWVVDENSLFKNLVKWSSLGLKPIMNDYYQLKLDIIVKIVSGYQFNHYHTYN